MGDHVKVGLLRHSEDGLVDAAAALQQGWKYDSFRSLGIFKFRSPAAVDNVAQDSRQGWKCVH
jgi:hypothetical protein